MTLNFRILIFIVFLILTWIHFINGELKQVISLPGLESSLYKPKIYSGYITTKETQSKIFSILVLADESPENKPFIVFQNGGPGSSSLQGFIIENGPVLLESDGKTLHENPDRWNSFANVLFMEAPGGVGFSTTSIENWNDELFAKNFVEALVEIKNQFPQYLNKTHPLWLTGESYAGAYLTSTMNYIVQNTDGLGLDFRGLFIGNGVANRKIESIEAPLYMLEHMIISDTEFSNTLSACDGDFGNENEKCQNALDELWTGVFMTGLNPYNLYDTCIPVNISSIPYSNILRKKLLRDSNLFISNIIGDQPLPEPCVSIKQMEYYFNIVNVQSALHVENIPYKWKIINNDLSEKYVQTVDATSYYLSILKKKIPIRHFSGDCDLIVNTRGTIKSLESFSQKSNFNISTKWQVWKDRNGRHGGYQLGWKGEQTAELSVVTIRGGSHMAASNRARQTVDLLKKFMSGL